MAIYFEQCQRIIETNQCRHRPRESLNDPNIKKNAIWMSHQQNNVKKELK